MRLTALNIASKKLKVTIQTTDHNLLRWTAMAIDVNESLAKSLEEYSAQGQVYLTDSIFLARDNPDLSQVPLNTHIILWDGVNSFIELQHKQPQIGLRQDLKFFVVGWLEGVMPDKAINISPLYPKTVPEKAKAWNHILSFWHRFHVPYWYRLLTTFLTHTRYFKNWVADSVRHKTLSNGGKIVFCGLVTPTEHNLNSFFIGINKPQLQAICLTLTKLDYFSDQQVVDATVNNIIQAIQAEQFSTPSEFACIYSILNVMHRIQTLSVLHKLNSDVLFVNEVRNSRRIDPYDSFFYQSNLFIDFGSTRGADNVYPRTLDMSMTNKRFILLRLLFDGQSVSVLISQLNYNDFKLSCESDAKLICETYRSMSF